MNNEQIAQVVQYLNKTWPTEGDGSWSANYVTKVYNGDMTVEENRLNRFRIEYAIHEVLGHWLW